jgi:hypothetical protein
MKMLYILKIGNISETTKKKKKKKTKGKTIFSSNLLYDINYKNLIKIYLILIIKMLNF